MKGTILKYHKPPPSVGEISRLQRYAFEKALLPVIAIETVSREDREETGQLWFSPPPPGVDVSGTFLSQRSSFLASQCTVGTGTSSQVPSYGTQRSAQDVMDLFDGAFMVEVPSTPPTYKSGSTFVDSPVIVPPYGRQPVSARPVGISPTQSPTRPPVSTRTAPILPTGSSVSRHPIPNSLTPSQSPPLARPVLPPPRTATMMMPNTTPTPVSESKVMDTENWMQMFSRPNSVSTSTTSRSSSSGSPVKTSTTRSKAPSREGITALLSSTTSKRKLTAFEEAAQASAGVASWDRSTCPATIKFVETHSDVNDFELWLGGQQLIACCALFKTEQKGIRWDATDVFGFFVYTDTVQWYFPLQPGSDVHDTILRCISTMFLKDTITKVIWNAKGCLRPLMQIIPSQPHRWTQFRDPQLAAWLLHTDCDEKDLIFKTVCSNYGVLIQERTQNNFGAGGGAHATVVLESLNTVMALNVALEVELQNESLLPVYLGLEMRVLPILATIEHVGVRLDSMALDRMVGELETEIEDRERDAHELAGRPFLLSSPQVVSKLLFDPIEEGGLGLSPPPTAKKSSSGHITTNEAVLQELSDQHPLPSVILMFRRASKILNTYVKPLPDCAVLHSDGTNCIHSTLHQLRVGTGRLSSSDPNLQNIPSSAEYGLRDSIIPRDGNVLMSFDYCQIEVRVLAHMCRDRALLSLFHSTTDDFYRQMAAQVFKIRTIDVQPSQRDIVKTVCLGFIYGMGAVEAARKLNISDRDARKWKDEFVIQYPGLRDFRGNVINFARKNGYVVTLLGRRRLLPDITSQDTSKCAEAERQAVNTVIQGSAADIIKLAMMEVAHVPRATIVLQIHDELLIECPRGEYGKLAQVIRSLLEVKVPDSISAFAKHWMGIDDCTFSVPLAVKCGVGENWGNLKPLE